MSDLSDYEIVARRSQALNSFLWAAIYALPAAVPPAQWIYCMFGALKSLVYVTVRVRNRLFAFACGVVFWLAQLVVPTLWWLAHIEHEKLTVPFAHIAMTCVAFSFFMNYVVGGWILRRVDWLRV